MNKQEAGARTAGPGACPPGRSSPTRAAGGHSARLARPPRRPEARPLRRNRPQAARAHLFLSPRGAAAAVQAGAGCGRVGPATERARPCRWTDPAAPAAAAAPKMAAGADPAPLPLPVPRLPAALGAPEDDAPVSVAAGGEDACVLVGRPTHGGHDRRVPPGPGLEAVCNCLYVSPWAPSCPARATCVRPRRGRQRGDSHSSEGPTRGRGGTGVAAGSPPPQVKRLREHPSPADPAPGKEQKWDTQLTSSGGPRDLSGTKQGVHTPSPSLQGPSPQDPRSGSAGHMQSLGN